MKEFRKYFSSDMEMFLSKFDNCSDYFEKYVKNLDDETVCNEFEIRVKEMFESKGFYFFEEIQKKCHSMHIGDVVEHYNDLNSKVSSMKKEYNESVKNKTPIKFTKNKIDEEYSIVQQVKKGVEKMIKEESMVFGCIKDYKPLLIPKNFKIYSIYVNNMALHEGKLCNFESKNEIIQKLDLHIEDIEKRLERGARSEEKKELIENINRIYDQNRNIYLEALDETDPDDEVAGMSDKFIPVYNEIRKIRKKYILSSNHENFDLEDLHLNKFEKEKMTEIIPSLVSDHRSYVNCLKNRKNGTSGVLYEPHNISLHESKYGISSKLDREKWEEEVFSIWSEVYINPIITEYEEKMNEFTSIVGLKPHGIITGFSDCNTEKTAIRDVPFSFVKNAYQDSFMENTINGLLSEPGTENDPLAKESTYLYKLINGAQPDLNKFNRFENKLIDDKISELNKKNEEVLNDVSTSEKIYDAITQLHEHDVPKTGNRDIYNHRPMNVTSGRRIEDEYETCRMRRKNSTKEFFVTAERYLIPLKNR
jgi:hypothetical protein